MAGDAAEDSGKKDKKSGNQEDDKAGAGHCKIIRWKFLWCDPPSGARRAEQLPEMKRAGVRSRQRYNWREPQRTTGHLPLPQASYIIWTTTVLMNRQKNLYRQGMSAFGGISPTYHIALAENAPVIVWNFHSLLVMIQMCFSFMLTDSDCDMKLCKHCGRAFIASRKGNEFCSPKCKNQYNVYKTRAKKKEE